MKTYHRDFPGSPVVKILPIQCRGAWARSLVRQLRSLGMTKKKKKVYSGYMDIQSRLK